MNEGRLQRAFFHELVQYLRFHLELEGGHVGVEFKVLPIREMTGTDFINRVSFPAAPSGHPLSRRILLLLSRRPSFEASGREMFAITDPSVFISKTGATTVILPIVEINRNPYPEEEDPMEIPNASDLAKIAAAVVTQRTSVELETLVARIVHAASTGVFSLNVESVSLDVRLALTKKGYTFTDLDQREGGVLVQWGERG